MEEIKQTQAILLHSGYKKMLRLSKFNEDAGLP